MISSGPAVATAVDSEIVPEGAPRTLRTPVPGTSPERSASLSQESPGARLDRWLVEFGPAIRRVAAIYAERRDGSADDLAQEIAVALWRALPAFRGEASEKTFVLRIAYHRGITHRARRRPAPLPETVLERLPSLEPAADAEYERRERRQALETAVRALPEAQRAVAALALEGMSIAESAEILGITENAATVRLFRARESLRARLRSAASGAANEKGDPR